jgi:hypothetical protein
MTDALPAMFHGTTRKSWARDETGLALHITSDLEAARDYARESRANWLLDVPDSPEIDAIVIEFSAQTLAELVSSGAVRLMPTQGDEELRKITDWRKGFAATSAVRLEGFENSMKGRGVIREIV